MQLKLYPFLACPTAHPPKEKGTHIASLPQGRLSKYVHALWFAGFGSDDAFDLLGWWMADGLYVQQAVTAFPKVVTLLPAMPGCKILLEYGHFQCVRILA